MKFLLDGDEAISLDERHESWLCTCPALFSMIFSTMLIFEVQEHDEEGIQVTYKTDVELLKLCRLKAARKVN